jgi:hypothetical protein
MRQYLHYWYEVYAYVDYATVYKLTKVYTNDT